MSDGKYPVYFLTNFKIQFLRRVKGFLYYQSVIDYKKNKL